MATETSGTSGASPANTGKADNYVPVFSNQQREYKEFKKRAEIYRVKMRLAGRQKETVFNLVTMMSGKAWDLVEDLPVAEMEKDESFDKIFERLDKGFRYDPLTELPDDFEAYFIKLQRRSNQTLQEWSAEYLRAERRLTTTHGVTLPEKIRAWFFLRRSGVSKEQRQLILTNVGAENLNLEAVSKAMNFILGQDSRLEGRGDKWNKKVDHAHYQDELDSEDWPDADATYYQDVGEEPPWLDADQAYYEDEATEDDCDDAWDVEEYDEIYAAYVDAKNRMNRMRTARGFYPVVALVDRPASPTSPAGRGKSPGKKGGGKRPGKKGQPGKQMPAKGGGSKAGARGKAAVGRQVCLRCGQAGHWARDCPAGEKKRRLDPQAGEVMMVMDADPTDGMDNHSRTYAMTPVYALDNDEDDDNQTCNRAVQDGGAASVLGSLLHVKRYLRHLLENGFPLDTLEVYACKKSFRYGNSATEATGLCVLLPVVMGGKKRQVLTYIIGGSCPILFGRPVLEKLEVTIDYKAGKMKWPGGSWQPISRGDRGEHQLVLAEDMATLLDETQDFEEILAPTDFETHVVFSKNLGYQAILGKTACPNEVYHTTLEKDHSLDDQSNEKDHSLDDQSNEKDHSHNDQSNEKDHSRNDQSNEKDHSLDDQSNEKDHSRNDQSNEKDHSHHDGKQNEHEIDQKDHLEEARQQRIAFDENPRTIPESATATASSPSPMWTLEEVVNAKQVPLSDKVVVKNLPKGKLNGFIASVAKEKKELKSAMDRAAHVSSADEKLVWEVFAGKGRLTASLKCQGAVTEPFSTKEGWNLRRAKDRKKFLRRLRHEEPDEVVITPHSRLWSPTLEKQLATAPGGWAQLCRQRQQDHDEILVFCALVFEVQRRGGRHAHLEHPWTSRAWKTKAFHRLSGMPTYVDQCMYGALSRDGGCPLRKSTCILTTKRSVHQGLQCECDGSHDHGREQGHAQHEDNEPPDLMAKKFAELIVQDGVAEDALPIDEGTEAADVEMEQATGEEAQEEPEVIKANQSLKQQVGRQAFSYVARLHKNLGHPSPTVLARMLEEVQATENVITCAKNYLCAACLKRKKPAGVPPASGIEGREFNERLMLDSAWIDTDDGRMCVLTIMCQATRFVTIRVLASEQSKELLKGLERAWIKHFGVPKIIRIDEAKGWSATLIREWCSDHGVELEIAPAEAHSWLGAVERRHQVVRRSLELYMEDRQDRTRTGLREAAIFVPGQINLLSSVKGFSPAQWVLGKTPANSFSLTNEIFNPAAPDAEDDAGAFAANQRRRTAAQIAFLKADTDLRLRRAMNRNYREGDQAMPKVGQKVFFWRIQGAGILQKNRWRGPARVVAVETDDSGKERVIWLAHGTSLLRCAPHQVRPVIEETGYNVVSDPGAAMEALQELKARSTTQFKDITASEPVLEDNVDDHLSHYEPSLPDDNSHPSDADEETARPLPPLPGVVELAFQDVLSRQRPLTRRISTAEPEPEHLDADAPPDKRARLDPARPPGATSSSSPATAAASARPEDTPVPEDDEELYVDAYVVDTADNDFPEGWAVVDGEIAIDEAWLARVEAKEKHMNVEQRAAMVQAKRTELESYFSNQVWQFAEDGENRAGRTVSARWVLSWKEPENGGPPKAKARLVLRGFEDPDLMNIEKASPTATRQSKMLLLAFAGNWQWVVFCGDVRTAFLSGAEFNRKIVVKLPADCGPLLGAGPQPTYMRMLKSAYGLADAPLLWWKEADRRQRRGGWERHPLDRCFYLLFTKDRVLTAALVLHVDDLLVAGDGQNTEFKAAIATLKKIFDFGKWQELHDKSPILYCGGKLERDAAGIHLGYADYLKKVAPVTVPRAKENKPLQPRDVGKLRGLIGALQWPAGQGLPALSASLSIQAAGINQADTNLVAELNKTLRFAKAQHSYRITMGKVFGDLNDVCLVVFSDAAFAVRPDGSSQGGLLVVMTSKKVLSGETVPYSVLSWRSHKLQRVCRSSLAAEAQGLATALDELVMVKSMVSLMLDPRQDPRAPETAQWPGSSVAVIDAKALYDALKKPGFTSAQDKRTAIEILCVQDELKRLGTTLRWVSSERMLADGLTKVGSRQELADTMMSGRLSLVFDKDFVAAKKKTKEERERAQRASGGQYGSRIAQHISMVLLAQAANGVDGKTLDDGNHATYYTDLFLGFLFLQFTFMLAYVLCKIVGYVTAATTARTRPVRTTADATTQTTGRDQDTKLYHLNAMTRQYHNELDEYREYTAQLKAENTGLWRQLEDCRHERDALRHRPQPGVPQRVWLTTKGQCFHPDENCGHLRGARPFSRALCRDCERRLG